MKVSIQLHGTGGLLDFRTVTVKEGEDDGVAIQQAVLNAVKSWSLFPGDAIRIERL